jgi:hypothetical protein
MDPDVTNLQSQIAAQIQAAGANTTFPPNRTAEIVDLQTRANNLVTEYKQDIADRSERLKREMQEYRDRIQRIVDEVNRTT